LAERDDAGKKINGTKRHLLVDTLGLLIAVVVHPTDVQDRDGAKLLLGRFAETWKQLRLIWGRRWLRRATDRLGPFLRKREPSPRGDRETLRRRQMLQGVATSLGSSNAPSGGSGASAG
jgi:transposase